VPRFLQELERETGQQASAVTDVLPGLDEDAQIRLFEGLGFWHRAKVLMRRPIETMDSTVSTLKEIRGIRLDDLPQVVGVYGRSYAERPGEFWVWAAPGSWREAEHDVLSHRDAAGDWAAAFRPDASFVWESGGQVLGAVLVEAGAHGIPYVEDLIVEPALHRRGIGRALLESALAAVARTGSSAIELAAIRYGAPYWLYRRVGFQELPSPEGRLDGYWVRGPRPFGPNGERATGVSRASHVDSIAAKGHAFPA
jgi:GNAT superfamily N-acetyltransferase